MVVNKDTRISALISHNKEVINTIASINKHFTKLKNPVLRRVLAPRVTVADAAKIGGVSISVFLKKLKEVGFEIENDDSSSEEPEAIKAENTEVAVSVSMDVRPIIESGSDPFKEIMSAVKKMETNETLEIINSFEPIPLIHKLQKKGFKTWTKRGEDGTVFSYFQKLEEVIEAEEQKEEDIDPGSFDELYKAYIGKMKYVDVRHLEMPEPMTTILGELEVLPIDYCLFVDHKKVPQFLLPELKERNFEIAYNEKEAGHIQLLIYKK